MVKSFLRRGMDKNTIKDSFVTTWYLLLEIICKLYRGQSFDFLAALSYIYGFFLLPFTYFAVVRANALTHAVVIIPVPFNFYNTEPYWKDVSTKNGHEFNLKLREISIIGSTFCSLSQTGSIMREPFHFHNTHPHLRDMQTKTKQNKPSITEQYNMCCVSTRERWRAVLNWHWWELPPVT